MAAREPTSFDLIQSEGERRGRELQTSPTAEDFDYHVQTYSGFLWWAALFVAHVLVILVLLAFFLVR
jgi:hypothetical protein